MANIKCKTCGTEYKYCLNCPAYRDEPKWRITFCSQNCKDIFDTLVAHTIGRMNKKEAKNALLSLDLSKQSVFDTDMQAHIEEILSNDEKKEKIVKVD